MDRKAIRIVLDVLLTLMIVFEMFIQYTGNFLHEVIGLVFFLTVLTHLGLSAKWMKNTTSSAKAGKLTGRKTALAVMAILLAITIVVLGVSSVAISNILASAGFTWTLGSYALWADIHTVSSYVLCALVVVHLAMHWAFLFSAFKVPYNPARRKAIGTSVNALAALGVVALGIAATREMMPQATAQDSAAGDSEGNELSGASDIPQNSSSSSSASAASSKKDKRSSSGSSSPSAPSESASSPSGESASSNNSSSEAEGICTLCRKRCPLSDPQCDKPYKAGLI